MKSDITIITHFVKQGQNEAFENWLHNIITDAAKFNGYQGINILKPADNGNEYVMTVRFADTQSRLVWETSAERKKRMAELYITSLIFFRLVSNCRLAASIFTRCIYSQHRIVSGLFKPSFKTSSADSC